MTLAKAAGAVSTPALARATGTVITPDLVRVAAPGHPLAVLTATRLEVARVRFGILSRASVCAWLANMATESQLQPVRENLYYTNAVRACGIFSALRGVSNPEAYMRNPEALANLVYANRGGNGSEASGDGWRYRGGGMLQNTFRDGYRATGRAIGYPLEARPEGIEEIGLSALASAAFWKVLSNADAVATAGNITATRRIVNGPAMLGVKEMSNVYLKLWKATR